MDIKVFFGIIPVLLSIPSYGLYIRSVIVGKTKPHIYSWLLWGILAGIAFAGQIADDAGPGAWNTGITVVGCLTIFMFALKKGDKTLVKIDKVLLGFALLAVAIQLLTSNHVLAVIMATMTALVGFIFTFKKAFKDPVHESSLTFFINANRNLISLFALSAVSFLTLFYPLAMALANASIVSVVLARRKAKSA